MCCSELQCVAVCCIVLYGCQNSQRCGVYNCACGDHIYVFLRVCCSVLQCVAVCCSVIQCDTVCYRVATTRRDAVNITLRVVIIYKSSFVTYSCICATNICNPACVDNVYVLVRDACMYMCRECIPLCFWWVCLTLFVVRVRVCICACVCVRVCVCVCVHVCVCVFVRIQFWGVL